MAVAEPLLPQKYDAPGGSSPSMRTSERQPDELGVMSLLPFPLHQGRQGFCQDPGAVGSAPLDGEVARPVPEGPIGKQCVEVDEARAAFARGPLDGAESPLQCPLVERAETAEEALSSLMKVGTIDLRIDYLRPATADAFTAPAFNAISFIKKPYANLTLKNTSSNLNCFLKDF